MKKAGLYRIILLAAVAGLLSQSCFVARNYDRPELPEVEGDALYRNVEVVVDSESVAMISWNKFFQDTILKGHIREALQNNLDLQVASRQVLIAESLLKQGKAGYWPSLNAAVGLNHHNLSDNRANPPANLDYNEYVLAGNLSWEADIWGKIRSNKRALEASFYRSNAVKNAVTSSLVASIASLYYELLSLDAKLALVRRAIEVRGRAVEAMKGLKDAGMTNEVGVQQTLALQHNSEAVEIQVENDIRILENAFSVLLGRVPGPVERGSFLEVELDFEYDTGVPYLLLQNRPDIIAAEYTLREAFELTNVARSNFYPSLTLDASGGLLTADLDKWFDASSLFSSILAGLTQPLFRQRAIRTQYEVAGNRQEQALLAFRKSLLTAGSEVSNALYNIDAADRLAVVKRKELEANSKATRFSAILLTQGYADYLEVLNANTNQLISEFQFVNAKLLVLQAKVGLYRALGGGWR